MTNRWETVETVPDFYLFIYLFIFLDSKITAMVIADMKLKDAYSLERKLEPT